MKEIKGLTRLQGKAEACLEPKRVFRIELFCENSQRLTIFAKNSIIGV